MIEHRHNNGSGLWSLPKCQAEPRQQPLRWRHVEPTAIRSNGSPAALAVITTLGACYGRWGDSPLRWLECLLFLEVAEEMAPFQVHYAQDKTNFFKPPPEWGIDAPPKNGTG